MVGYQGLSERSRSQRQSGTKGRATQTGTPRRTGEMGDGGVGGDDEVEIHHDGGGVHEGTMGCVEVTEVEKTGAQIRSLWRPRLGSTRQRAGLLSFWRLIS